MFDTAWLPAALSALCTGPALHSIGVNVNFAPVESGCRRSRSRPRPPGAARAPPVVIGQVSFFIPVALVTKPVAWLYLAQAVLARQSGDTVG
ncbi:hypothetical protein [Streptomyces capoamus]|uniref:hypothetical protein n=1 Tax=Streptomyces capoamus TaxID=68183 RepID=UPI0033976270